MFTRNINCETRNNKNASVQTLLSFNFFTAIS